MKALSMKFFGAILLLVCIIFTSCKKDEDKAQNWVAAYTNVSIGGQDNTTIGNFFEPQTGNVIAVENTSGHQQYIGLMFFTESGGANTFFTFPANGEEASTFGTSGIRLFTQVPGGIDSWEQENMVSGMIYLSSMTSLEFDNLIADVTWEKFNSTFVAENNGNTNLSYKLNYELNPDAGNVYLVEFNGVVRAIICIRNVVPSSAKGSSIKFDAIVEGRDAFANSPGAKYIAPIKEQ